MNELNHSKKQFLTCFVIMPFSDTNSITKDEWDFIFLNWIKKAVESFKGVDILCKRSNIVPGNFVRGIIKELKESDFTITDLTGQKPNVCYELGVRHSLNNGNIIITQDENDVPSDLSNYSYLKYDYTNKNTEYNEKYKNFKNELHNHIKSIYKKGFSSDNPVSDYIEFIKGDKSDTKYINTNAFRKLLELSIEDFKGLEIASGFYKDEFPWIYDDTKSLVQMLNSKSSNSEKIKMIDDLLKRLLMTFYNPDLKNYYSKNKLFQFNFTRKYIVLKQFLENVKLELSK